jgi:hypothetical protein
VRRCKEHGESGFASHAMRILPRSDQELGGGLHPDARGFEEERVDLLNQSRAISSSRGLRSPPLVAGCAWLESAERCAWQWWTRGRLPGSASGFGLQDAQVRTSTVRVRDQIQILPASQEHSLWYCAATAMPLAWPSSPSYGQPARPEEIRQRRRGASDHWCAPRREHGPGGVHSIQSVALAIEAARSAIRAHHFHHLQPFGEQKALSPAP